MKLLPRTLTGRTLLLVFAAVLLSEGLTFWAADFFRRGLLHEQHAHRLADAVRTVAAALEAMPPEGRARFADPARPGQRVFPLVAVAEPGPPLPGDMAERLSELLGEAVEVRASREPASLWISFPAAGERWWFASPRRRLDPPLPWALIGAVAAAIGVILGLSAAFVANIARPLRALTAATGALGAGRPHPVQPNGPTEVRTLAERFNAMLAELENAEAEQRVMLAGLPHDLRGPLARLKLRLALLDDAEARAGIARDAEDIERIAAQFVAYLRGAGVAVADREALALDGLVEECVARYRQLGVDAHLAAVSPATVLASREALARLLDNLMENARRYAPGRVELSVGADEREATLAVRDFGSGIPPERREQALQPFTRLDAARAGSGCCGLGLAIVERIARAHGGRVSLEDAPGGGLAVRVVLPLAPAG